MDKEAHGFLATKKQKNFNQKITKKTKALAGG
jgi:hypothetical protein